MHGMVFLMLWQSHNIDYNIYHNIGITVKCKEHTGYKEQLWIFLDICPAPIGYEHIILHVSDHLHQYVAIAYGYFILRPLPAIHKINALREVFWHRVGKFLLKSIIALLLLILCFLISYESAKNYNQTLWHWFE